ncbi:hypothetical protein AB395_00006870 (plasmid) [Sinorhizobium fredii CCBAU 45436]|nr:hypothetical protein AB395_00006870 [Sinorhizobium fredii CCBAU 45436]
MSLEDWSFTFKIGPRPVKRWTWDARAVCPETIRTERFGG